MDESKADRRADAERSALSGCLCAQCDQPFPPGRTDKRYCTDKCRARASRKRRARQLKTLIAQLTELAGKN